MVNNNRVRKVLRKIMYRSLKPGNRRSLNENDMETIDRAAGSQIANIAQQDGMDLFVLCRELDSQYFAYTRRQRSSIKRLLEDLRSIDFLEGDQLESTLTAHVSNHVVGLKNDEVFQSENVEQPPFIADTVIIDHPAATVIQPPAIASTLLSFEASLTDALPAQQSRPNHGPDSNENRKWARNSALMTENLRNSFVVMPIIHADNIPVEQAEVVAQIIQTDEIPIEPAGVVIPMEHFDNNSLEEFRPLYRSSVLPPIDVSDQQPSYNYAVQATEEQLPPDNHVDEILQHPENVDPRTYPLDPEIPRRTHTSRIELHLRDLLGNAAAAQNHEPVTALILPDVTSRVRQRRRPRAVTPLEIRFTKMNRLFKDVRMPKRLVERSHPSDNVLTFYRRPETMLPADFDPVELLKKVHLDRDRQHAQEQRSLQEQRDQLEKSQNRRQTIIQAVAQARAVSLPDSILTSPQHERLPRNMRSTPDSIPLARNYVEMPINTQNISLTDIPPFFNRECGSDQIFNDVPFDHPTPGTSGIEQLLYNDNMPILPESQHLEFVPLGISGTNPLVDISNISQDHEAIDTKIPPKIQTSCISSNMYRQEGKRVIIKVLSKDRKIIRNVRNLTVYATLLKIREMSNETTGWKEVSRNQLNAIYKDNGLVKYDLNALQVLHTRGMLTLKSAHDGPNFVIKLKEAGV